MASGTWRKRAACVRCPRFRTCNSDRQVIMSDTYGKDAPLSYNKYLRVPELVDLQTCLSSPAHHDELLFITVHQAYELWFKQILHEIDAAIGLMKEDHAAEGALALRCVVRFEKCLIARSHIH